MIQKFLNSQTKKISVASLILAISYLLSAVLGLLRDRLLAGRVGTENLDMYYAAFVVPDFIALILIFGAISAALIPIFSSYYVKSKDEAWHYLSAFFNVFLGFLILVCFLLIVFAPYFVSLVAPGFSQEKREVITLLMRIMFLSPIILGISNIMTGILQVFHKFLVTALAPVMYNLGIIFGILFLTPKLGLAGLAWGVVLGGILHLLIQMSAFIKSGFQISSFKFQIQSFFHPGVLKTLKLMAPRSLGLGANQFNIIVITSLASTLASGSIAVFNLANNLSAILVNAISVSISTAIFPTMTLAYLNEDKKGFEKKFSVAFRQILFLTIPLSLLIFILRAQIVRVVLGWGLFNWLDTRLTAACLGIFALSLFAQGLTFIVSKTFYASQNTKIPALVSIISVFFNILMSFVFVGLLNGSGFFHSLIKNLLRLEGVQNISVVGLVMSYSLSYIIYIFLLVYFLYKKLRVFRLKETLPSLQKIIISSAAMVALVFLIRQGLVVYGIVRLETFLGVFLQLAISGLAGIACYIVVSYFLKSSELKTIKESFLGK